MSLSVAVSGFGLGLALITPIGAQNAYVLRTAVRAPRAVLVAVVTFVIVADIALIAVGAAGAGAVLDGRDWLRVALYAGGIALLAPLGVRTLAEGLRGGVDYADALDEDAPPPPLRTAAALSQVAALTLLNPHVYLDTVAILGSAIASHEPGDRASFTAGAMLASFVWFTGLAALGAVVLRRFGRPVARAVDILGGAVMLIVAVVFAVEALRLIS